MLTRILEPEVMDSAEEARDYDGMDHSHVNRVFVTDLLRLRTAFHTALDVGAGTAQIPIELCQRHPTVHVTAIDLAEHMLRVGRVNVERVHLAQRIKLECCDAKRMPFTNGAFDVVMSNSIIHHIPDPFAVFAEMARVVKPGGLLFVRDLLRPENLTQLQSFVHQYAGDANAHQQKMFADSLHAALTLGEVRNMVAHLGYDAATVQATSDRHWTFAAVSS
jgi:ubiquinone/menaquinone biosynthesis C-methylase UbiE